MAFNHLSATGSASTTNAYGFGEAEESYFEYYGSKQRNYLPPQDFGALNSTEACTSPLPNSNEVLSPSRASPTITHGLHGTNSLSCQSTAVRKPSYREDDNTEWKSAQKGYPSDPFASEKRARPSPSFNELRNKRKLEKRQTYFNPFSGTSHQYSQYADRSREETLDGKIYRDTYNRHLSLTFLHVLEESNELLKQIKSNIKQNYDSLDIKKPTHRQTKSAPYKPNQEALKALCETRKRLVCNTQSEIDLDSESCDQTKFEYFESRESFGVVKTQDTRLPMSQRVSIITQGEAFDSEVQNKSISRNLNTNFMCTSSLNHIDLTLLNETPKMMNECSPEPSIPKKLFRFSIVKPPVGYNKRYSEQNQSVESTAFEDISNGSNQIEAREMEEKFRVSHCSELSEITKVDTKSESMISFDEPERERNRSLNRYSWQNSFQEASDGLITLGDGHIKNRPIRYSTRLEENKPLARLYTIEDEMEETPTSHRSPILIESKTKQQEIPLSHNQIGEESPNREICNNDEPVQTEWKMKLCPSKILVENTKTNQQGDQSANINLSEGKEDANCVDQAAIAEFTEEKNALTPRISPKTNRSQNLPEEKSTLSSQSKSMQFKRSDTARKTTTTCLHLNEIQSSKSQRSDKENNCEFKDYKVKRKDWFQSVYDGLKRGGKPGEPSTTLAPPRRSSKSITINQSKSTRLSIKL